MDVKLSMVVVGCCALTGCFDGDTGSLEDVGGTDPTGLGSEGPEAAGTGLDDTSDGNDEGGTSGEPPGSDPCDFDCGEGGSCEIDDVGAPSCACAEGYAAFGLRCLPCTPTRGAFDVDVPSVEVTATFLLGGESFPDSVYERGRILLRDPATGDEVVLGDTRDGEGEATVVPGAYEVVYVHLDGETIVPVNQGATVATLSVPDTGTHALVVDVPVVELSGSLTFNGGPPPDSTYENGTLVLVNAASGDEVPLGDTRHGEYRVNVIPGSYRVHYRRKQAETLAPINHDARLAGELVVGGASGSQTHDIDVEVTTISGAIRIDGDVPPASVYENGRIVLRNTDTGDEVEVGQTRDGSYQAPVVAGPYEVFYERLQGGQLVPVNRSALLAEVAAVGPAHALDVDIDTAVVTGTITVAGQVPPADPGDDGLVYLRNPATGDEALLGNTANAAYSQRVVLGDYDVYYRQETSSGGVPVNTNAFVQAASVRGGASLDVDVPMVTVSATVTVGGQAPPESVYDDGVLYLRNAETGDSVLLGNTRLAALERPVVPGSYDVHYVVEAAGPTMPINARSRLATVDVGPATALDIDIPVAVLQGAVTVAGQPPPQSAYERAALLLQDVATSDVLYLGAVESGGFARTLTSGTYILVYQSLLTTTLLPANTKAGLACIELTAP
jgi:hypothetical protein